MEEEKIIDEALPKDLAKAYKRNDILRPRETDNFDTVTNGYGGYRDINRGRDTGKRLTDFANSDYKQITPEEAMKRYKAGTSRNLYAVLGGKLVNAYWVNKDGSKIRQYDYKAERDYTTGSAPFQKENGKIGKNSTDLTPKEIYNNASAIYEVNEVDLDPQLIIDRRVNPESKYSTTNTKNRTLASTSSKPQREKARGALVEPGLVRDTWFSWTPKNADEWYATYKQYDKNSTNAKRAYGNYILAKTGEDSWLDYDAANMTKDAKAKLRYWDAAVALRAPITRAKQALKDLQDLESNKNYITNRKATFTSPQQRQRRESSIQSDIQYYKGRLLSYLRDLEEAELKLDDLDAQDAAQIKEYDDQINDIIAKITSIKQQIDDMKAGKTGIFDDTVYSKVVPEGLDLSRLTERCLNKITSLKKLREEKSLAEVTDEAMGIEHEDPLDKEEE